MLWTLKSFDLAVSNSGGAISVSSLYWHSSWAALHPLSSLGVFLLWLLHSFSKWVALSHCEYLLWYVGHLFGTFKLQQHLQFMNISLLVDFPPSNLLLFCQCLFTVLNSLLSFVACKYAFCTPWISTLLAHAYTSSLVIWLVFLTAINSHMISVIISSLFMLLIYCSFSPLSFSLYLLSFALILKWPIHSLTVPLSLLLVCSMARIILSHCVWA